MSAASRTRTPKFGDTNNDPLHMIDFADISAVVNAFRNVYSPLETYQSTNIMGSGAQRAGSEPGLTRAGIYRHRATQGRGTIVELHRAARGWRRDRGGGSKDGVAATTLGSSPAIHVISVTRPCESTDT